MTRKEKQEILWRINLKENEIQRKEKTLSKLYKEENPDFDRIDRVEDDQLKRYLERNAMVDVLQILCNKTERVENDRETNKWFIHSTLHNDMNICEKP